MVIPDEDIQYAAKSGSVETGDWQRTAGQSKEVETPFSSRFAETPRMIWGIKFLDALIEPVYTSSTGCPRARLQLLSLTPASCKFSFLATSGSAGFAASYLTLPKNGIRFDSGTFDSTVLGRSPGAEIVRQYIPFSQSFDTPPVVRCWFTAIDTTGIPGVAQGGRQLTLNATRRTASGFTLTIQSDYAYTSASIGWLAYDSAEDGKRVRSDRYVIETTNAEKKSTVDRAFTGEPFAKVPAAFLCCDSLSSASGNWVRWNAQLLEVTKEKIKFHCGIPENPSSVTTLGFTWIAME